ncbi:MAG: hypothetical protein JNK58_14200 [Phycisphaerae bacterium]|nr:hypothetical protein [Phycisphaerae bacterium]
MSRTLRPMLVRTSVIVGSAVLAAGVAPARADLLASVAVIDGIGGLHPAGMPAESFSILLSGDGQPPMFAMRSWTLADIGTEASATSATDPAFDINAAFLTNDISQIFFVSTFIADGGGGTGQFENLFFGLPPGTNDFAGYEVQEIRFRLDSATLTEYIDPLGGGEATLVEWIGTISVYGVPIPAPGAASLAIAAGLLSLRRRR